MRDSYGGAFSDESFDFNYHTDRVRCVSRTLLLSRKRKLSALYFCTSYATVDTSKYDTQEYRDNERAFLDANDLQRSVITSYIITDQDFPISAINQDESWLIA